MVVPAGLCWEPVAGLADPEDDLSAGFVMGLAAPLLCGEAVPVEPPAPWPLEMVPEEPEVFVPMLFDEASRSVLFPDKPFVEVPVEPVEISLPGILDAAALEPLLAVLDADEEGVDKSLPAEKEPNFSLLLLSFVPYFSS